MSATSIILIVGSVIFYCCVSVIFCEAFFDWRSRRKTINKTKTRRTTQPTRTPLSTIALRFTDLLTHRRNEIDIPKKLATLTFLLVAIGPLHVHAEVETSRQIGMICLAIEVDSEDRVLYDYVSGFFSLLVPTDSVKYEAARKEISAAFLREINVSHESNSLIPESLSFVCEPWPTDFDFITPQEYFAILEEDNERDRRMRGSDARQAILTGWTPNEALRQRIARQFIHSEGASGNDDVLSEWRKKNGIEDQGSIANTLALMVQIALILQEFDPGPADGLFRESILASILTWQVTQSTAQGDDLAEVIVAILRAAMVLQGYDPAPEDKLLGPKLIQTIETWSPVYEEARQRITKSKNVERHVAEAVTNDCIQVYTPPGVTAGTFFKAQMKNLCGYKVHVNYGFNVKYDGTPIRQPWCTPGHGGSIGGALDLKPGENKPVAPMHAGVRYSVFWCACSHVYSWAAFAEPSGPGVGDCSCRCAPH